LQDELSGAVRCVVRVYYTIIYRQQVSISQAKSENENDRVSVMMKPKTKTLETTTAKVDDGDLYNIMIIINRQTNDDETETTTTTGGGRTNGQRFGAKGRHALLVRD
jgi:hypothetical protein